MQEAFEALPVFFAVFLAGYLIRFIAFKWIERLTRHDDPNMANNKVLAPNNKLAQAIVTNFHLPGPRMSLQIGVNVSNDADKG